MSIYVKDYSLAHRIIPCPTRNCMAVTDELVCDWWTDIDCVNHRNCTIYLGHFTLLINCSTRLHLFSVTVRQTSNMLNVASTSSSFPRPFDHRNFNSPKNRSAHFLCRVIFLGGVTSIVIWTMNVSIVSLSIHTEIYVNNASHPKFFVDKILLNHNKYRHW